MTEAKKKFSILVEWTRHCNIRCSICPIDSPDMRSPGHMELELWGKILDDCVKNGHFINWVHHLGEPLLWRHFERGMELWRQSGLSLRGHISTNGILLNEERLRIIKEVKPEFVRICVDTLRPEVYKRIRANDNHALIIENVRRALDMAPELNIQVQLMRTSMNEDERPEDFLTFFGRRKNLTVFLTTAMDLGKAYDFKLLSGKRADPRLCNKVFYEHCIIGWDGTVGLCCPDYWLRNRLGNITDMSISEVFNGDYANMVRRMIREGDFSLARACDSCSMDHMKPIVMKLYRADDV